MVHCLAGAHRAGTAGTAYVMYKVLICLATSRMPAATAETHFLGTLDFDNRKTTTKTTTSKLIRFIYAVKL